MNERRLLPLLLVLAGLPGCRQDMHDQPKYQPLQPSALFEDGTSARHPVEGTVARGQLRADSYLYTGRVPDTAARSGPAEYVAPFPFPVSREDLERGRERFDIFCSVCHGRLGYGDGMIPRRGFRRPPSYHDARLRDAPVGYLFDVITNGYGAMPDYSAQIPVEDRWRIVAWVRTLQFSQNATLDDVPAAERAQLGD